MGRISDKDKQQRKERVWLKVQRHKQGITEKEIADFVGIGRRTVNSYLNELENEYKIYKDGTLWCPLDYERTRLRAFELSPEEGMTLYLATRLLVKQQDKRNEIAETVLMRLGSVLTADAGVGEEIVQAAQEMANRPTKAGYHSIYREMMQGYIYRKKVVIRYKPLGRKSFETTFATYLLEPSPIGFCIYCIGHSSASDALRSYKLERIESARLTQEEYLVPDDFPGLTILRNAWSVIFGDELTTVVLRFSPQVRERVLETEWHPSQQVEKDGEKSGYLRWQADVADTKDMLPWIRGWGADVEVLEPVELRERLMGEARAMARLYGWYVSSRASGVSSTLDDFFGGS